MTDSAPSNLSSGPNPPPPEAALAKARPASKAVAYYVARKAQKKRLGVIPRG